MEKVEDRYLSNVFDPLFFNASITVIFGMSLHRISTDTKISKYQNKASPDSSVK